MSLAQFLIGVDRSTEPSGASPKENTICDLSVRGIDCSSTK